MSIYRYYYSLKISFSEAVRAHKFIMKCLPQDNNRQKVYSCNWLVEPDTVLTKYVDWAGNISLHGTLEEPHREFNFKVWGEAETACDISENFGDYLPVYRYATPLTAPGEKLKEFFASFKRESVDAPYPLALSIMHAVNEVMSYKKGATDISTSAEEAFERGYGVCQDYAHIMLALCRMAGLPCKYIVGFIAGEGESHAWVEVQCRGYWYGFDPTNNMLVCDGYIKVSEGRDFEDTELNRGCFNGIAVQKKEVYVSMEKIG